MSTDEIYYIEGCYCSLCDQVFISEEARSSHLQSTPAHPGCDKCNRRFPDKRGLRIHYLISREHHYCSACDMEFKSASGLKAHCEFSADHLGPDERAPSFIDEGMEDWEEFIGSRLFACENANAELRRNNAPPIREEEIWTEDYELDYEEDEDLYQQIKASRQLEEYLGDDQSQDNQSSQDDDQSAFADCFLCSKPYDDQVSATKCGHVFCTSCIKRFLKKRKECPICDRSVCHRNLRTLYLF